MDFERPSAANHSAALPTSKTPGRILKGSARLQENLIQNASATMDVRGKKIAPITPFREKATSTRLLKGVGDSAVKNISLAARPLADKTPAPNRHNATSFTTPLTHFGKQSKLPSLNIDDVKERQTPVAPPSSTRKKLRFPRSASKSFETPVTKGDHWNVSDISIDLGCSSLGEADVKDEDEPDYSDIEYMPPKAIELSYEPAFEMPDYKELGKNMLKAIYSYPVDETPLDYDENLEQDDFLKEAGWKASSGAENLKLPPEPEDIDHFAFLNQRKLSNQQDNRKNATGAPTRRTVPSTSAFNGIARSQVPVQSTGNLRRPIVNTSARNATSSVKQPIAVHSKSSSTASSTTTVVRRVATSVNTAASKPSRAPSTLIRRPISEMAPRAAARLPPTARSKSSASVLFNGRARFPSKSSTENLVIKFNDLDLKVDVIDDFRFAL